MDNQEWLDIYTDYQINSFGLTTGTGLLRLLDGAISHDRLQRLLASSTKGSEGFVESGQTLCARNSSR